MNLGENLQILRKTKGMSQEELAEKLEVSRQAVSKWETGETSPETEKIIMICDIFDCSMDELVKGKITNNNSSSERKVYDRFMNKFSKGIAIGVFLILLGVTSLLTIMGFIPNESLEDKYVLIGVSILLLFIVVAVPIFIILGLEMDNMQKKYKALDNFYTEEEVDKFNKKFSVILAICVSVILIGVVVLILLYGFNTFGENSTLPVAIFLGFISISVPFMVYAGIEKSKFDLTTFKHYHNTIRKEAEEKIGKISGVIMMIATMVFFVLGSLFDAWEYTWIVYPVGGMLCGIVAIILNKEN